MLSLSETALFRLGPPFVLIQGGVESRVHHTIAFGVVRSPPSRGRGLICTVGVVVFFLQNKIRSYGPNIVPVLL